MRAVSACVCVCVFLGTAGALEPHKREGEGGTVRASVRPQRLHHHLHLPQLHSAPPLTSIYFFIFVILIFFFIF